MKRTVKHKGGIAVLTTDRTAVWHIWSDEEDQQNGEPCELMLAGMATEQQIEDHIERLQAAEFD